MVEYDDNFLVADLKAKCKELGLPIYGRKKDLIIRLNNHKLQENEHESVDFIDVSVNRSIVEPAITEVEYVATTADNDKRKRVVFDYRRDEITHDSLDAASNVIATEGNWNKFRTRTLKSGTKIDYYCRHQGCLMRFLKLDFDSLFDHLDKVRLIKLERANWTLSQCSCAYFQKKYFCYHLIVVAVNERLATIPIEFIKDPIERATKPGRKKKKQKKL